MTDDEMTDQEMKCEKAIELLPDYLQGSLDDVRMKQMEAHVAQCAQCGDEAALWHKLGSMPEVQPSPMLRSRFESMLETYQEGRWEKANLTSERNKFQDLSHLLNWVRRPSMSAAWAAVLVVAAFLGGKYMDRGGSQSPDEVKKIHQELTDMRQLVVLSMLQQQSASERLQAVSYSRNWNAPQTAPDPKVLSALMHTLQYDQSVDVRLAALDALTRYGSRTDVRKGLIDALEGQQSPLVQVALIDALVDMHDPGAVQQLKKLQENPKLDPSVRKRADWGVTQLS